MSESEVPAQTDPRRSTQSLADPLPCFVVAYDDGPVALYASARLRASGGLPSHPVLGLAPEAMPGFDAGARAALGTLVRRTLSTGEVGVFDVSLPEADAGTRLYRAEVRPERDAQGRICGALVIGRALAGGDAPDGGLEQSERAFRSLAENAGDVIIRWDTQAVTLYVNPALDQLYQGRGRDMIGRTPTQAARRNPAPMQALEDCVLKVATTGRGELFELQMRDPQSGQRLVHQLRVVPERDGAGRVVSVLGVGRDVTGTVAQMEQIESLLHVDTLTQLANRQALKDRGGALVAAAGRRGQRVGLLLLDLDHFKAVNDGLGHGAGDELLVAVAQRLRACARGEDLLCRLGGDEFVLVVHEAPDRDSLHALARRMHETVAQPLRLGDQEVRATMSIGLALFPDDAPSLEELLARADAAMYQAKRAGRGRTADYTSALEGGMHGRLVI